jgi:hypothetical protein
VGFNLLDSFWVLFGGLNDLSGVFFSILSESIMFGVGEVGFNLFDSLGVLLGGLNDLSSVFFSILSESLVGGICLRIEGRVEFFDLFKNSCGDFVSETLVVDAQGGNACNKKDCDKDDLLAHSFKF